MDEPGRKEDLERLEEELELDFFTWGWEAARADEKKGPFADTLGGNALVSNHLAPLVEAIRTEQKQLEEGLRRDYGTALLALDPSKLALLTLRAILNALVQLDDATGGVTVMKVVKLIGSWCWLEVMRDAQKGRQKVLFESLVRRNRNPHNARRRAETAVDKFYAEDWNQTHLDLKLGGYLLDVAMATTGLFHRKVPKKRGRQMTLELTPSGREELARLLRVQDSIIAPRWPPMVVPPRPWKGLRGGGYVYETGLTLVIDSRESISAERLEKADLRVPCQAVNALQETPWRINKGLWELFLRVRERKSPAGTLPHFEFRKLPPPLPDDAPEELQLRRRRERRDAYRANREAAAHQIEVAAQAKVVAKVQGHAIYFPHHLDWRGRAYPIPQYLNPQGDEIARAVLEFDRAKPLGERGAYWLAVHLANCFGKDKIGFRERVAWVNENDAAILDSATNPLNGTQLWAKADKPWRFLAAAREWAGYRREGPRFASRVPVAMDGTCNGLQHLSALGRDPEGGRWTNLVPGDAPQDIYAEVARRLVELLRAEAAQGFVYADHWLPLVDRKLVKQPTMTTPYGAGLKAFERQIKARLRDAGQDGVFPDLDDAAEFLAPRLREAIARVVVGASKISRWLQRMAAGLAKQANAGIDWTSPIGLPVEQRSLKLDLTERVETLAGVLGRRVPVEPHVVDPTAQRKGIVPNLVHSLDAAHMMRTVNALRATGLRDFAMVHDSYAVHACDVDSLNAALREEFVKLHEDFTLEAFGARLRAAHPDVALSGPPERGGLDLAVQRSAYFFA